MKAFVDMLGALGHATRLGIFRLLVRAGPQGSCVDDIRRQVRTPGSTLSHHLDALTRCGLLRARREGRFIYYAVNWPRTAELLRFLTEDCCAASSDGGAGSGAGATSSASPGRRKRTLRRRRATT